MGYFACAIATSAWDAGSFGRGSPFSIGHWCVLILGDSVGLQLGEKLCVSVGEVQGSYQCELYSQYMYTVIVYWMYWILMVVLIIYTINPSIKS